MAQWVDFQGPEASCRDFVFSGNCPGRKLAGSSLTVTNSLDGNSEGLYCAEESMVLHVLADYPVNKRYTNRKHSIDENVL